MELLRNLKKTMNQLALIESGGKYNCSRVSTDLAILSTELLTSRMEV
jgi:hypothetical protein